MDEYRYTVVIKNEGCTSTIITTGNDLVVALTTILEAVSLQMKAIRSITVEPINVKK